MKKVVLDLRNDSYSCELGDIHFDITKNANYNTLYIVARPWNDMSDEEFKKLQIYLVWHSAPEDDRFVNFYRVSLPDQMTRDEGFKSYSMIYDVPKSCCIDNLNNAELAWLEPESK